MRRVRSGEAGATGELVALLYKELHAQAGRCLTRERQHHTLQPTALVHEAWLRLFDAGELDVRDEAHFVALAASVMRRVLVEHARERAAQKRGGDAGRVTLTTSLHPANTAEADVLELDEALERLRALDERQARLVELRFFGGLSVEETAAALGISKRSAEADWTLARAFLHRELSGG